MQGLRSAWREAKNIANGYSDIQAKLRDATSIDKSGPSTGQLQEIAAATNHPSFMGDLIYIFNKRLNDHGKYWRHVYKTLVLLEFCVIFGSDAIVQYAKESLYKIKTLKEFIHIDDKGRDKGILVREKSKDLVELLNDELLLAQCRQSGQLPNYKRPKSAEPIIVDPKHRKRIGGGECQNFSDLQTVDENEAMRMALTASRSDNSRYQSLELDTDSSSEDDKKLKITSNPFSVPSASIEYSSSTMNTTNPFINFNYEYAALESSYQEPLLALPVTNANANDINPFYITDTYEIPQIEYNLEIGNNTNKNTNTNIQQDSSQPFIPRPDALNLSSSENFFSAKPVGPHMAAPQFSYNKSRAEKSDENPFGEDLNLNSNFEFLSEAAQNNNSPHFNLQK